MTTTIIDKSTWPDGPWKDEPDELMWRDEATGLDCRIARTRHTGALCGYVRVDPGHPLFGKDYLAEDFDPMLDVHGGLTFAGPIGAGTWWLGFDCAHSFDLAPAMTRYGAHSFDRATPMTRFGVFPGAAYRDISYVRSQVTKLAAQLVTHSPPANT